MGNRAKQEKVGESVPCIRKGLKRMLSMDEDKKIRSRKLKELEMIEKSKTPYVYNDSNYKRVQYTRYADDFIIGVIGSKADAESVRKDVKTFLQDVLKLEMSDTKTKVTHTGGRAGFLGYDITVSMVQTLKRTSNGKKQRCQTGVCQTVCSTRKMGGQAD